MNVYTENVIQMHRFIASLLILIQPHVLVHIYTTDPLILVCSATCNGYSLARVQTEIRSNENGGFVVCNNVPGNSNHSLSNKNLSVTSQL